MKGVMPLANTIEGMESLMRKLNALGGNVQDALNKAVTFAAMEALGDARANLAYEGGSQGGSGGNASGSMTLQQRVELTGNIATGIVEAIGPLVVYREFGTGPVGSANHAGISPKASVSWSTGPWRYKSGKRAGKLIPDGGWIYKGEDGEFHHTRGQPARPYLYPAAVRMKTRFSKIVELHLKSAIGKLGG